MKTAVSNTNKSKGILKAFGEKIISLRKEKGIDLSNISAKTGIMVSTLSRIESGEIGTLNKNMAAKVSLCFKDNYYELMSILGFIDDEVFKAIMMHPEEISRLVTSLVALKKESVSRVCEAVSSQIEGEETPKSTRKKKIK